MVSITDYNDVFSRTKRHFRQYDPQITDHQIRLEILITFGWMQPKGISLHSTTQSIGGDMYIWVMQRSNNTKIPYRIKLNFINNELSVDSEVMLHKGPL